MMNFPSLAPLQKYEDNFSEDDDTDDEEDLVIIPSRS